MALPKRHCNSLRYYHILLSGLAISVWLIRIRGRSVIVTVIDFERVSVCFKLAGHCSDA